MEGQTELTDARVHAGSITSPDVDVSIRNGLASVHIEELDVQVRGNASLILGHVKTNKLAVDNWSHY